VAAVLLPALYVFASGPAAYGVERAWVSPGAFSVFHPLLRIFRPGRDNAIGRLHGRYVVWWVHLAAVHEGRAAHHAP
jgi:hypothetical protein